MLLMLVFIGVQYNDPDGAQWMVIYAIPSIWLAIAAFRHSWLVAGIIRMCLLICILLSVAGVAYYWPDSEGWWRQKVWWEVESVREGMGMMIISVVLFIVWLGRPRLQNINDSVGSTELER